MFSKLKYKLRTKDYLFSLLKIIVLACIIFLLDLGIGFMLRYFYFKQETGLEYRTAYAIDTTTADLLIFGSSRANHQYYPDLFEKQLNITYYNVGRDGTSIFYHYAVLQGVLERYSPKIVILDFDPEQLQVNSSDYDKISCLLPYYKDHPEIRSVIELKSPYEKIKLLSKIYPFNSLIFTIAAGNSEFNKKRSKDNKGYLPLYGEWNRPLVTNNIIQEPIIELDRNKIRIYESFIIDCLTSNIDLYIVSSPIFSKVNYQRSSLYIGKQLADKYNVRFINYSNIPPFINDPSLFVDILHLNDQGARLFSNLLIEKILLENNFP